MNTLELKGSITEMVASVNNQEILQQLYETITEILMETTDKKTTTFWTWIEKIDSNKLSHQERLKPLINALSTASISAIHEFSEQLAFHLHQLDGPAYFEALKNREQGVSADTFLYARCLVVAKGKVFYHKVLDHPEKMPIDEDMEALLYVDEQAYEQKTGEVYKNLASQIILT